MKLEIHPVQEGRQPKCKFYKIFRNDYAAGATKQVTKGYSSINDEVITIMIKDISPKLAEKWELVHIKTFLEVLYTGVPLCYRTGLSTGIEVDNAGLIGSFGFIDRNVTITTLINAPRDLATYVRSIAMTLKSPTNLAAADKAFKTSIAARGASFRKFFDVEELSDIKSMTVVEARQLAYTELGALDDETSQKFFQELLAPYYAALMAEEKLAQTNT